MKKIILAAASLAALSAGSAFADPIDSGSVVMNATVLEVAVVDTGAVTEGTGATVETDGSVTLETVTADAELQAADFSVAFAASANYAHNIKIASTNGGLTQVDPVTVVDGTFIQRIGYTATVTWGGEEIEIAPTSSTDEATGDTDNQSADLDLDGAVNGDITIDVVTDGTTEGTVLAGAYTDTLTVTLGPIVTPPPPPGV